MSAHILEKCRTQPEVLAPECTARPVFHLQEKVYTLICAPEWLTWDVDSFCVEVDEDGEFPECFEELCEDGEIKDKKIYEWLCSHDWDGVVGAVAHWSTVTTFFSRNEAEAFANQTSYRYPMGWQVYCQPSEGLLSELLEYALLGGAK